jgi:hypothetical protein
MTSHPGEEKGAQLAGHPAGTAALPDMANRPTARAAAAAMERPRGLQRKDDRMNPADPTPRE